MQIPKILNIGCGSRKVKDELNLDINPKMNPDIVMDISKVSFGKKVLSEKYGEIEIKEEMFDEIHADHVLEHIPDIVSTMWNCYKLLKWDGVMKITVPYDLSYGAWQDPTHVRAFNQHSWKYWCMPWCKQQLAWEEGFSTKPDSIILEMHEEMTFDLAVRTPRAIEQMQVTLYKTKKI